MTRTTELAKQSCFFGPGSSWIDENDITEHGRQASPDSYAKKIRRDSICRSGKNSVQPNWIRQQQAFDADYNNAPNATVDLDILLVEINNYLAMYESVSSLSKTSSESDLALNFGAVVEEEASSCYSRAMKPEVEEKVLESLIGFVDQIEGSTAYVTLTNEKTREQFSGYYNPDELRALGVEEHRSFSCQTIQTGTEVLVRIIPRGEKEVSLKEEQSLDQRLEMLFEEDDLDGDY